MREPSGVTKRSASRGRTGTLTDETTKQIRAMGVLPGDELGLGLLLQRHSAVECDGRSAVGGTKRRVHGIS
jgi:hypothetical protein